MMTRKHYRKVAAVLKERRRMLSPYDPQYDKDVAYNDALDAVAEDLCSIFAEDNGAFDRNKFLTAAGVRP